MMPPRLPGPRRPSHGVDSALAAGGGSACPALALQIMEEGRDAI